MKRRPSHSSTGTVKLARLLAATFCLILLPTARVTAKDVPPPDPTAAPLHRDGPVSVETWLPR